MFKEYLFNEDELKREKSKYYHIGIPGLKRELEEDNMILFAGRPAMGKTSFLCRVAIGACINKLKVAYFSLGEPKVRLMQIMACELLECSKWCRDSNAIYEMLCNSEKGNELKDCYLFDNIYSFAEIYNIILNLDRDINGLDLVIIDGADYITDYSEEIYDLFKALSWRLKIRFIFSIKAGRSCECRNDNRPKINDIKNICQLLEYFPKIILLYREKYYNSKISDEDDILELDIYKVEADHYEKVNTYKTMFDIGTEICNKSLKELVILAEQDDEDALYELEYLLNDHNYDIDDTYEWEYRWYLVLATKCEDSEAMMCLYELYMKGIYVKKDEKEALKWLKRATNYDYTVALKEIINYYFNIKNYEEVIKNYERLTNIYFNDSTKNSFSEMDDECIEYIMNNYNGVYNVRRNYR